jgi:hypothetical protein
MSQAQRFYPPAFGNDNRSIACATKHRQQGMPLWGGAFG